MFGYDFRTQFYAVANVLIYHFFYGLVSCYRVALLCSFAGSQADEGRLVGPARLGAGLTCKSKDCGGWFGKERLRLAFCRTHQVGGAMGVGTVFARCRRVRDSVESYRLRPPRLKPGPIVCRRIRDSMDQLFSDRCGTQRKNTRFREFNHFEECVVKRKVPPAGLEEKRKVKRYVEDSICRLEKHIALNAVAQFLICGKFFKRPHH